MKSKSENKDRVKKPTKQSEYKEYTKAIFKGFQHLKILI